MKAILFEALALLGLLAVMVRGGTPSCASNPCYASATCVEEVVGHTCICPQSYTGIYCQTIVDECASNPCMNGGSCFREHGTQGPGWGHTCFCIDGFGGLSCQTDLGPCGQNRCLNGGTCVADAGPLGYNCTCADGFIGFNCTTYNGTALSSSSSSTASSGGESSSSSSSSSSTGTTVHHSSSTSALPPYAIALIAIAGAALLFFLWAVSTRAPPGQNVIRYPSESSVASDAFAPVSIKGIRRSTENDAEVVNLLGRIDRGKGGGDKP